MKRKELSKKIGSSLNGSLLLYHIQMSSFWGCLLMLLILYLQPIAPKLPGLEEDQSCLLEGSTRNCCKQENCGPSEYEDTPETWLQRTYLLSKNRFLLTTKKIALTKVYPDQEAINKLVILYWIPHYWCVFRVIKSSFLRML